ncbi:MAG: L,D-transpeptidase family protein [Sphingomicrobium sp.]
MAGALVLAGCAGVPGQAPPPRVAAAPVPTEPPYRWTQGAAPQAHKDMVATFGRAGLKSGEYLWVADAPAAGEPRVVVDLLTQMAYAYRGDVLVGASSMSSAKRGMVTPLGFWTVLEKKKFHRSRKYDNAPMPFMQRIDKYGIALHAGHLPGYAASHGCIRLPAKFAERLYQVTSLGSTVVIGA